MLPLIRLYVKIRHRKGDISSKMCNDDPDILNTLLSVRQVF